MLQEAARRTPEATAVVDGTNSMTYQQYVNAAAGLAQHLVNLDLSGKRIAVLLGNSIDMCIAMFGIHAAGAVAVPMNPLYSASELSQLLNDSQASGVLCDGAARAFTSVHLPDGVHHVVSPTDFDSGFRYWADDCHPLPRPLPEPQQPGSIQYTGGTTGLPKGVVLTHAAIATNISQREALLPTEMAGERLLCVAPLFHVYAMSMCLHNMCYCSGTLYLQERFEPSALLRELESRAITILAGNPTLFSGLMNSEAFGTTDFSSLRYTYSGAAPLPLETLSRWESTTGSPVFEGYGLSEAGPVVSFNPSRGARKPGSVGIAVPGTDIRIAKNGEVQVRGPQLMSGYWQNAEETNQVLIDGWLHTGDLGKLDEDGYLFIRGRLKDMLKVSGFSVFPREIEEVLHQHEQVVEAAVVGRADAHRGEVPVAFVVCDRQPEIAELLDHCRARLASYKVPSQCYLAEALPRTGPGKVDKQALAEEARRRGQNPQPE